MSTTETNTSNHPEMIPAQEYIQAVREHYRHGDSSYVGRRNDEQEVIAELSADEARIIVDGTMAGILAVARTEMPEHYEDVQEGGFTWGQFRSEFERLMAGFGVITHRLNRDGYDVPSYLELNEDSRAKVASSMLSDFLTHNALRFGVDTSGVRRTDRRPGDDGKMETVRFDPDEAKHPAVVRRNMKTRKYTSGVSTHTAGKMSPKEYQSLRRQYSEFDKDTFDNIAGNSRNATKTFEESGQ